MFDTTCRVRGDRKNREGGLHGRQVIWSTQVLWDWITQGKCAPNDSNVKERVIPRPFHFCSCPWPWTTLLRKGLPRKPARPFVKVRSVEPSKPFIYRPDLWLPDGDLTCTCLVLCLSWGNGGIPPHRFIRFSHLTFYWHAIAWFPRTTTYVYISNRSSALLK